MYGDEEGFVLCPGVWNGLHPNHIQLLEFASQYGPVIAACNGDEYNQRKNGGCAIPSEARAYLLKSIKYVREVIVFEEPTPSQLILRIRPRYLVKGPDYIGKVLAEEAACLLVGCEIKFRPGEYTYSSRELFKG